MSALKLRRAAQQPRPKPSEPFRPIDRPRRTRVAAWTLLGCAAVLALGTFGCRRISQRTLKDTEGRVFEAECDRENCKLTQTAGPPAPTNKPVLALAAEGRLVGVCNVKAESAAPEGPGDCRALECATDADCPPAHGQRDGSCVNQLCISTTGELAVPDAVMMCLAGTGLGRTQPGQVGLYAMALNCGEPCAVPKPCRQP